jgi:hypothetical protein
LAYNRKFHFTKQVFFQVVRESADAWLAEAVEFGEVFYFNDSVGHEKMFMG